MLRTQQAAWLLRLLPSFKNGYVSFSQTRVLSDAGMLGKWFSQSGPVKESQSDILSDRNDVFELQMHSVKPEYMANYLDDFSTFVNLMHSKGTGAKLVASFTSEIGDQDEAIHLWKFSGGYPTLDRHYEIYRKDPDLFELRKRRNEMLRSRKNQICLPFSFWPEIRPRSGDHIYELRSYNLKPGTMIEWGNHWALGIQFRKSDDEAVCGLFTNIGDMHVVHHIFAYRDLEHRKQVRDDAWRTPGWDQTVLHTVPLIKDMKCMILRPTPMSSLK